MEFPKKTVIDVLHDKEWVTIKPHPNGHFRMPIYHFKNGSIIAMFQQGILFAAGIGRGYQCVGEFFKNLSKYDKERVLSVLPELYELYEDSSYKAAKEIR